VNGFSRIESLVMLERGGTADFTRPNSAVNTSPFVSSGLSLNTFFSATRDELYEVSAFCLSSSTGATSGIAQSFLAHSLSVVSLSQFDSPHRSFHEHHVRSQYSSAYDLPVHLIKSCIRMASETKRQNAGNKAPVALPNSGPPPPSPTVSLETALSGVVGAR
jgi:hypothetical protein